MFMVSVATSSVRRLLWVSAGMIATVLILGTDFWMSGGVLWDELPEESVSKFWANTLAAMVGLLITFLFSTLVCRWSPLVRPWAIRVWLVFGAVASFAPVSIWLNTAYYYYGTVAHQGSYLTLALGFAAPVFAVAAFSYVIVSALIARRVRG